MQRSTSEAQIIILFGVIYLVGRKISKLQTQHSIHKNNVLSTEIVKISLFCLYLRI